VPDIGCSLKNFTVTKSVIIHKHWLPFLTNIPCFLKTVLNPVCTLFYYRIRQSFDYDLFVPVSVFALLYCAIFSEFQIWNELFSQILRIVRLSWWYFQILFTYVFCSFYLLLFLFAVVDRTFFLSMQVKFFHTVANSIVVAPLIMLTRSEPENWASVCLCYCTV